jgi:hypothetical protein
MNLLDKLKLLFATPAKHDYAMWLYVKCARCGAPLAVRVDLRNELSIDYDNSGYILHKEMMDSKCFTLMHARVRFDDRRNVVEQTIEKGTFITREEFEAMTNAK